MGEIDLCAVLFDPIKFFSHNFQVRLPISVKIPFGALSRKAEGSRSSHRRLQRLDLDCRLCGGYTETSDGQICRFLILLNRPSPEMFHSPHVLLSRLAVQAFTVWQLSPSSRSIS